MRILFLFIFSFVLACHPKKEVKPEEMYTWVAQVFPVKLNPKDQCNPKDKARVEYERVFTNCMNKVAVIIDRGVKDKKPVNDTADFRSTAVKECINTATTQAASASCYNELPDAVIYAFRRSTDFDCRESSVHHYTAYHCVPCENAGTKEQQAACRSIGFPDSKFKEKVQPQ